MKTVRKTPILLLLALAVVVWGCSNGGGSPTAPVESITAEAQKPCADGSYVRPCPKPDDPPTDPPPLYDVEFQLASGSQTAFNLEKISDRKIGRHYPSRDFNFVKSSVEAMASTNEDLACVQSILGRQYYTESLSVEKLRKGGVEIMWEFFIVIPGENHQRWELWLTGDFVPLSEGDNFPPVVSSDGDSNIEITEATLERGHGKGECTFTAKLDTPRPVIVTLAD